jgi:hypothetical protein
MPALPFVFFTNELHVLPPTTLQNGPPPSTIQITKRFFQSQIEELKDEFSEVQSMGVATAEEWIKGLDERGKDQRTDAGRWEKWEVSGGAARMRGMESQEAVKSTAPTRTATPSTASTMFTFVPPSNGHNSAFQSHNSTQLLAQTPSQIHQPPQPIQASFRRQTLDSSICGGRI